MNRRNVCKLIYEEKQEYDTIYHERENVKYSELNVYSTRYYLTLANNSMRLDKMIKLREFYMNDFESGILKYVYIGDSKYAITKVSSISGRYITLDLEEII